MVNSGHDVCICPGEGAGPIAGIVSAIGVALFGAASSYFAYQKKKLCFKMQGGQYVDVTAIFRTAHTLIRRNIKQHRGQHEQVNQSAATQPHTQQAVMHQHYIFPMLSPDHHSITVRVAKQ